MSGAEQIDLEDWLETFEMTRPAWLEKARATARLLLSQHETIHINQVRDHCPIPSDWDGRVYGAVFRHPDFEATGQYVRSSRETCHKRPIQLFRLAA